MPIKGFNLSFLPKQVDFFSYFKKQIKLVEEASEKLIEFLDDPSEELMKEIERLESEADEVWGELRAELNQTFITPLEREDIHDLGILLDDIIDFIKSTAERFWLYQPKEVLPQSKQMAQQLKKMVDIVVKVIEKLEKLEDVSEEIKEINRMESEGDALNRRAIASLFKGKLDVIEVIKWKELFEKIEEAMDRCQHTALLVENIILKHV